MAAYPGHAPRAARGAGGTPWAPGLPILYVVQMDIVKVLYLVQMGTVNAYLYMEVTKACSFEYTRVSQGCLICRGSTRNWGLRVKGSRVGAGGARGERGRLHHLDL